MAFRRPAHAEPREAVVAYRSGRYVEYLAEREKPVPAWAWLNAMAHGSVVLVSSLAVAGVLAYEYDQPVRAWHRARKTMAMAVMENAGRRRCSLADVQAEVLCGLELELAATAGVYDRGPIETTCMVLDALGASTPHLDD